MIHEEIRLAIDEETEEAVLTTYLLSQYAEVGGNVRDLGLDGIRGRHVTLTDQLF